MGTGSASSIQRSRSVRTGSRARAPLDPKQSPHFVESTLVAPEPREGLPQLRRDRARAAAGPVEEFLQVGEPATVVEPTEQLVASLGGGRGHWRARFNPGPGRQGPLRASRGLLAEAELIIHLGRTRSEAGEPDEPLSRRNESPASDLELRRASSVRNHQSAATRYTPQASVMRTAAVRTCQRHFRLIAVSASRLGPVDRR